MKRILLSLGFLLFIPAVWAQHASAPRLGFLDIKTFIPAKKQNDIRCFYALTYATKPERFTLIDSSTRVYSVYSWLIDTKQVVLARINNHLYVHIDGKDVAFPYADAPGITVRNKDYELRIYCSTCGPRDEPVEDKLILTDLKTKKRVLLSIVSDCL